MLEQIFFPERHAIWGVWLRSKIKISIRTHTHTCEIHQTKRLFEFLFLIRPPEKIARNRKRKKGLIIEGQRESERNARMSHAYTHTHTYALTHIHTHTHLQVQLSWFVWVQLDLCCCLSERLWQSYENAAKDRVFWQTKSSSLSPPAHPVTI